MKYILSITFALLTCFSVKSQNYIPNSDFETPSGANDDTRWPHGSAEADKMSSWESRTFKFSSGTTHHSPDWIHLRGINTMSDFQATTSSPFPSGPQSGQGMVGMFNYELIQTFFNQSSNPLDAETYHTLSMWIFVPSWANQNCKLQIKFAKTRIKYQSEKVIASQNNEGDVCNSDYISYQGLSGNTSTMCEFDISQMNLPTNTWQKISATFKTPKNSILTDYDWFVIELQKNGYTGTGAVSAFSCNDSYIFIDNLSLVKSSFCSAVCAPNLGSINVGTIPNASNQVNAWLFTVQNAISIEFAIYDRWGALIDEEEAFDPNGLIDQGYSDYQFSWNVPGTGLPQDVYNYTLKIKNCTQTQNLTGNITILGSGPAGNSSYNILNFTLADCCVPVIAVSDFTYNADKVEAAKSLIIAGENINMGGSIGPVVVKQGVKVRYVSKKVDIRPGFIIEKGSDFKAILTEDCAYQGLRVGRGERMKGFVNDTSSDESIMNNNLNGTLAVFPNPSSDIFNFKSTSDNVVSVQIYNNLGQLITLGNKSADKYVVNLRDFKSGVFVYKVLLEDGTTKTGKLIKSE